MTLHCLSWTGSEFNGTSGGVADVAAAPLVTVLPPQRSRAALLRCCSAAKAHIALLVFDKHADPAPEPRGEGADRRCIQPLGALPPALKESQRGGLADMPRGRCVKGPCRPPRSGGAMTCCAVAHLHGQQRFAGSKNQPNPQGMLEQSIVMKTKIQCCPSRLSTTKIAMGNARHGALSGGSICTCARGRLRFAAAPVDVRIIRS